MITEFEEHHLGSSKVQFTVSRSSLPNLLEWKERLQTRFQVTINIQWELDQDAAGVREGAQVRWVALTGHAEDCKKAKNYIIIFCDAPHKMNITYPENIHAEIKESQARLEEDFSSVLQFLKVGQLLVKSYDEINLSLVLSVIEDAAARYEQMQRLKQSVATSELTMQGMYYEEPIVLDSMDDDLEVDSIVEETSDSVQPSKIRNQVTAPLESPSKQQSPKDLLGGVPLMLRGKGDVIFPGQLSALYSPESSQDSISPDRKKIKSQSYENRGNQSHLATHEPRRSKLFTLNLSSQQKLAIQRLIQRGDYTQSEIDRLLQKVGGDWKCSDLTTMLRKERARRNVPEAASHHTMLSGINLDKLKSTQESLIQSVLMDVPADPIVQGSSSDFWPKKFSTPTTQSGQVNAIQPTETSRDTPLIKKELPSDGNQGGKHFQKAMETKDHSGIDDMSSVITVYDSDSIIIIPSGSESDIVIGDSSEESDTYEEFYEKGVLQERRKKKGTVLSQRGSKAKQTGHSKQAAEEKQRTEELRGVVESLKQQLRDLQDKMERERAEASSQQQVVTLLQQTQQEEMERQYRQQQQKLLEQQQQFEKQFEMQQQKLKAQQEIVLKQLQQQQQQQQEKATALPDAPSEAIVIAPARKTPASPLRPVVIDGSNVAMRHGRNKIFSCRGIALCIQYFQKRGHQDITVFVPQDRRTQNPNKFDRQMADQKILVQLEKQGLLSFTPSRRIGNNYVNCYDDRFIVELAVENDGVIVSNDNYRDLMSESPRWRYAIENRLVMFTFAGDHFMIPDDPMGRSGPRIDQLLRKSTHPASAAKAASQSGLTAPWQTGLISGQCRTPLIPAAGTGAIAWGTSAVTGAQLVKQGTATTHQRPQPVLSSTPTLQSRTSLIPAAGTGAIAWGTSAVIGARQQVKHGTATTHQRPQPALSSAQTLQSRTPLIPAAGIGATAWGTGAVTGAQLVKQGTATTHQRPQPALHSTSSATTKPMLAATFGKKASGKDPTLHPCYETLMTIFPDNEDAVLRVLTKFSDKDDANELVIQVLVEKEKSESTQ